MPIQIVITGDHVTDAIAEIQQLAQAINGPSEVTHTVQLQAGEKLPIPTKKPEAKPETATESEAPAPQKLSRKDQDVAVEEMINAGARDERYDLLTKGRQKQVDAGIQKKVDEENQALAEGGNAAEIQDEKSEEAALESMFDDEPTEAPADITADDIRAVMAEKGKGADGESDPDKLVAIRDVLVKHIPEGTEIKVGNIPQEAYAAVHADLQAIGS